MKIRARKRHKFAKEISAELNTLIKLDNWHGIIALAYDYAVIGAAVALYFISPYFYPLSIIIIGARQGALSNLLHEAAHLRLTKNKELNYFIGTYLTGYLILQEFYTFSDSHIRGHHNHFGDEKSDPDYSFHIKKSLYKNNSYSFFIRQYIIKPFFFNNIPSYIKHIFIERSPTLNKNKKYAIRMYLYLLALVSFFGYFHLLSYFFLFWVIPFFTIFPIIGWFIDLAEHYPLVGENEIDIYMTRNRFSHFLEDFIFNVHNENYHLVHHLRPAIPFWNLRKAHHVLLKDNTYKKLNKTMGGIFLSSNDAISVIRSITTHNKRLFKTKITSGIAQV